MITNFTTPVYEELQLADGTDLNNVNPEIEVREDMKYANIEMWVEDTILQDQIRHEPQPY